LPRADRRRHGDRRHAETSYSALSAQLDRLLLAPPSKKEKCEKPQTCSYNAEAKNDYCKERCMAGQCTILHGQISLVTVLRAHYVQLAICEQPALGSGRIP
jgi:hypothetical protein